MKNLAFIVLVFIISSCANIQSPQEAGLAVGKLLTEIQAVLDEIDANSPGDTLPPLKSAQITLNATEGKTKEGNTSFILTGAASKSITNSNSITLVLVPNKVNKAMAVGVDGKKLAAYIIAAVSAINENNVLSLKSLEVEAGFVAKTSASGGIDIELTNFGLAGTSTKEVENGHKLKLTFAHPDKKKA